MTTPIQIGRLLRASTTGCVVGCHVNQISLPAFGGLVRIPLDDQFFEQVFGVIYDIHIDDDGLVRQLATSQEVSEDVILDNRANRNVPVEISVLFVGYLRGKQTMHLLPSRPPLTLDILFACSSDELCRFTASGHFGYFRHILRAADLPTGELLAAHVRQAALEHEEAGNNAWVKDAVQELITLLRDDYPTLMSVLGALSDTGLEFQGG
jgi:hypothetical protein